MLHSSCWFSHKLLLADDQDRGSAFSPLRYAFLVCIHEAWFYQLVGCFLEEKKKCVCYYYRAIAFLLTITGDLILNIMNQILTFVCLLRCDDKNIKYKWVYSRDPLTLKQKWYLPDASDVE